MKTVYNKNYYETHKEECVFRHQQFKEKNPEYYKNYYESKGEEMKRKQREKYQLNKAKKIQKTKDNYQFNKTWKELRLMLL